MGTSRASDMAEEHVQNDECDGEAVRHILSHPDIYTILDIFNSFDTNNDGVIDAKELKRAFPRDAPPVQTQAHGDIRLSQNSDGVITKDEWLDYFAGVKHCKTRDGGPEAWAHFLNYIEINSSLSDRQMYHLTEIFNMHDSNQDRVLSEAEMASMRLCD